MMISLCDSITKEHKIGIPTPRRIGSKPDVDAAGMVSPTRTTCCSGPYEYPAFRRVGQLVAVVVRKSDAQWHHGYPVLALVDGWRRSQRAYQERGKCVTYLSSAEECIQRPCGACLLALLTLPVASVSAQRAAAAQASRNVKS